MRCLSIPGAEQGSWEALITGQLGKLKAGVGRGAQATLSLSCFLGWRPMSAPGSWRPPCPPAPPSKLAPGPFLFPSWRSPM